MTTKAKTKRDSKVVGSLPMTMKASDEELLIAAYQALEHPSFAARLSNVVGTPIEVAIHLLPRKWYKSIQSAAEKAIAKSLSAALSSINREHKAGASETYHNIMAAGSGAVGGLFGLPGLLIELPITTTLMMRGIAEIARQEGEDIDHAETQWACVQVFAFGGPTEDDDAAETGYYSVRLALSSYVSAAGLHIMRNGLQAEGGPVFLSLINAIAHRFGLALSNRSAAQLIPVVGALGGATVNTIFMHHFQSIARAHFRVRRLERKYGEEFVRARYRMMAEEDQPRRSSK